MTANVTRKTLIAMAALAGLVAGGTALGSAAEAATHTASKSIGKVAFTIGGADETHQVAVVHGAITDGGRDDASHDAYDVLHMSKGTLRVTHPETAAKYTQYVNPKSCYATFTETGKFTADHGTGAYAGVTGKGTYTASGVGILKKTKAGKCDENAAPSVEIFVVHGLGTFSH